MMPDRCNQRANARSPVVDLLVLQATPFCNIDCTYCYLPHRSSRQRMSESTLARTFERVFSSPFLSNSLTVLWHAGEPLVPGIAYYQRAFEILAQRKPKDLAVTHNFQTNGTLLTPAWIEFFKAHNVMIGVSLDGPASMHDRCRQTRKRMGTFDQVMRGLRILRENEYSFNVITVLTLDSLKSARELFDFYTENGIEQVAFNIEEVEGGHTQSSLQTADVDHAARRFYQEFMDLAASRSNKLEVREFTGAYHAIVNPASAQYGNPMTEPLRALSVGVNGELSTFSPELLGYGTERHGPFVFGNVHDNNIADMLTNDRFLTVNAEIERGLANCRRTCEYFELCLGGCPVNKLFENGTFESTETLFCRLSKKAVIDVVLGQIERGLNAA
jgi:uncharacterized protein